MSELGEEEGCETTGSMYSLNMWCQGRGPSPLWGAASRHSENRDVPADVMAVGSPEITTVWSVDGQAE